MSNHEIATCLKCHKPCWENFHGNNTCSSCLQLVPNSGRKRSLSVRPVANVNLSKPNQISINKYFAKATEFNAGKVCSVVDLTSGQSEIPCLNSDMIMYCLVCDENISQLLGIAREEHLNSCLDKLGPKAFTQSLACTEETDIGLRGQLFYCVICDLDLSKRSLTSRCQHLKKCAKEYHVATKELLQMVSPMFNDLTEEDEEPADGEFGAIAVSNVDGNINTSRDVDNANSSKTIENNRNAWTVMMQASSSSSGPTTGAAGCVETDKSTDINNFFKKSTKSGSKPTTLRSSAGKTASKTTTGGGGGSFNNSSHSTYPAPAYKKVQVGNMSVPIVVDGFQYYSKELTDCYFLTHFHSDHYIGLDKCFDAGVIYCSPTTAGLVRLRLGITGTVIVPLEMEKIHTIAVGGADVKVVLIDANHCPGAVCILFMFDNGKKILHTGDFRWSNSLLATSPTWRALGGVSQAEVSDIATAALHNHKPIQTNLTVYLDTTYCDVCYNFPHQDVAITAVIKCVTEELQRYPSTLFIFGAYGIGKERVFMAVAESLNLRVHVDKSRWKGMMCYDWSLQLQGRLTTDPAASCLWVLPMHQINFNGMAGLLKRKASCQRVVGFLPTGWTHGGSTGMGPAKQLNSAVAAPPSSTTTANTTSVIQLTPREKNGNVIYSVPYSEHSSFGELTDFIRIFRPHVVIPTVNTSIAKVKDQIQLLTTSSGIYKSNTGSSSSEFK